MLLVSQTLLPQLTGTGCLRDTGCLATTGCLQGPDKPSWLCLGKSEPGRSPGRTWQAAWPVAWAATGAPCSHGWPVWWHRRPSGSRRLAGLGGFGPHQCWKGVNRPARCYFTLPRDQAHHGCGRSHRGRGSGLGREFSQASLVLIGGGPPCQGVSGLNSQRKGALRDERSSLFPHVRRIGNLVQRHFPWCQVHCIMESVASMDAQDRDIMSADFGDSPWYCDAGTLTWTSRPRLYWITWELQGMKGASLSDGSSGAPREVRLEAYQDLEEVCCEGWIKVDPSRPFPTFTTARPRSKPGHKPAGIHTCNSQDLERWGGRPLSVPPLSVHFQEPPGEQARCLAVAHHWRERVHARLPRRVHFQLFSETAPRDHGSCRHQTHSGGKHVERSRYRLVHQSTVRSSRIVPPIHASANCGFPQPRAPDVPAIAPLASACQATAGTGPCSLAKSSGTARATGEREGWRYSPHRRF